MIPCRFSPISIKANGSIRPYKPTPRKALGVATKARKAGNRGGAMIELCEKTGGANVQRVEWNPSGNKQMGKQDEPGTCPHREMRSVWLPA